jgi:RNA-directed DNA polymerase
MMNGREKSGSVVVAVNAPNKAGRLAAEARERRAGTEGKAGQHGTHRALNQARVSHALERLRQAARQRKKDRFTALLHHVKPR